MYQSHQLDCKLSRVNWIVVLYVAYVISQMDASCILLTRVQREQLGAIFRMMEKNQETFGMMSEVDLKDQLRLYNM